jgi:hypothetical protein
MQFSIQPFSHSAIQPFSHSAIQPFSHSAIQPFSHSAIQPLYTISQGCIVHSNNNCVYFLK